MLNGLFMDESSHILVELLVVILIFDQLIHPIRWGLLLYFGRLQVLKSYFTVFSYMWDGQMLFLSHRVCSQMKFRLDRWAVYVGKSWKWLLNGGDVLGVAEVAPVHWGSCFIYGPLFTVACGLQGPPTLVERAIWGTYKKGWPFFKTPRRVDQMLVPGGFISFCNGQWWEIALLSFV